MTHKSFFNRPELDFEVAGEVINTLVAAYSRAIGEERARSTPSVLKIKSYLSKQEDLYSIRETLTPHDHPALQRFLEYYGPLARKTFEQPGFLPW